MKHIGLPCFSRFTPGAACRGNKGREFNMGPGTDGGDGKSLHAGAAGDGRDRFCWRLIWIRFHALHG